MNKVHLSDIKLITQLFFPSNLNIKLIDPAKQFISDEKIGSLKNKANDSALILSSKKQELNQYEDLYKNDYILSFDSDINVSKLHYRSIHFNYINNPDGTIRWVFTDKLRSATYLNFYNSATRKAKLFSVFMRLFHNTLISKRFISGTFVLYTKKRLKIERTISTIPHDNFSIFTGTVGPNRKAIVELNTKGKTTHFVKVALTEQSKFLIKNEVRTLNLLADYNFEHIVIPTVSKSKDKSIGMISNVKPAKTESTSDISDTHLLALKELYAKTASAEKMEWKNFKAGVFQLLLNLKNTEKPEETKELHSHLEFIM